MRVMTYNILDGGRDAAGPLAPGSRLSSILEVIERVAPDLLLLNECALFELEGGRLRFELERRLSLRSVFGRAPTGHHLTLFVPSYSLLSVEHRTRGFHHGMLRCALELAGERFVVSGCHFDPWCGDSRLHEARQAAIAPAEARHHLLLGDLNSVSPRDRVRARPEALPARYRTRHLLADGALDTRAIALIEGVELVDLFARMNPEEPGLTRPTALVAGKPGQRLDYIFATADLAARCNACWVERTAAADRASDHYPVVAELSIGA